MRSKIILVAALAMGLITTVLFFDYMKKYDSAKASNETMVEAVAAKQAIKANTKISASMLEIVKVPSAGLHPSALKSPSQAEGKIAGTDLAQGEILLANHVKNQADESIFVSKKVKDGYRAVSVGVNLVESVTNLIEPGDFVDVISTPTDNKSTGAQLVTTKILDNIRVLAVGRRMVEADASTQYVEYSSVTLEVKPEDAVNLVNADERGNITLMLRTRVVASEAGK